MTWTAEMIERIPVIYRDFLIALKPIVDSKRRPSALDISGIPLGMVYSLIASRHDVAPEQAKELAKNLKANGLITEDKFGFFAPTSKGEDLIEALSGELTEHTVPQFPTFR